MVSNRALAVLVVASIVVSVVGTVFSIGLLSSFQEEGSSTGYASGGVGRVELTLPGTLSITTDDSDAINFSGCRAEGRTVYSNTSGGNTFGDCKGFVPSEIIVRNNGVYPANVSLEASNWGEAHGGSFVNATSDSSWIAFRMRNDSSADFYGGGCVGSLLDSWSNITDGNETVVCDRLAADGVNNSMGFDVAIYIPNDTVPNQNNLSLTFWATEAS